MQVVHGVIIVVQLGGLAWITRQHNVFSGAAQIHSDAAHVSEETVHFLGYGVCGVAAAHDFGHVHRQGAHAVSIGDVSQRGHDHAEISSDRGLQCQQSERVLFSADNVEHHLVVATDDAFGQRRISTELAITDQARPEAAATVAEVTELTCAATILLTGDNAATATPLAGEVGIADVQAGLLPDDKVTLIGWPTRQIR